MKNKSVLFITILSIIILFHNCSKEENLILNEEYITVSDLHQYCGTRHYFNRTKCNECSKKCDGKEVKIKGHFYSDGFNNLSNNTMVELPLKDIRNGYSISINFNSNDTAIINKILLSNETDMCYIKGTVKSVCDAGWVLISINLLDDEDIFYKSEINY